MFQRIDYDKKKDKTTRAQNETTELTSLTLHLMVFWNLVVSLLILKDVRFVHIGHYSIIS